MKLFQLYPKALAHLTCKSPFRSNAVRGKWWIAETQLWVRTASGSIGRSVLCSLFSGVAQPPLPFSETTDPPLVLVVLLRSLSSCEAWDFQENGRNARDGHGSEAQRAER